MAYLAALVALAVLYFIDVIDPRDRIGPVPTPVPWFGALGGVLISLTGTFDHYADWLPSYRFWHWARPFIGATVGVIAVLIFQAGVLAVGEDVTPENATKDIFYYVLAFLIGYKERAFRDMMSRVGEVVLSPGDTAGEALPTITLIDPPTAPAGVATPLTIRGSGLGRVRTATFGDTEVTAFDTVADRYIKLTAPASAAGPVTITLFRDDGETVEHGFNFT
jgi:hypothetical protein